MRRFTLHVSIAPAYPTRISSFANTLRRIRNLGQGFLYLYRISLSVIRGMVARCHIRIEGIARAFLLLFRRPSVSHSEWWFVCKKLPLGRCELLKVSLNKSTKTNV